MLLSKFSLLNHVNKLEAKSDCNEEKNNNNLVASEMWLKLAKLSRV